MRIKLVFEKLNNCYSIFLLFPVFVKGDFFFLAETLIISGAVLKILKCFVDFIPTF